MTMINTLANMFRNIYGDRVDNNPSEIAIYHDALHAATGLGISTMDEIVIQGVEDYLRGNDSVTDPDVQEALMMLPEELKEEFKAFYANN